MFSKTIGGILLCISSLAAVTRADMVVEELTFGHGSDVSPDGSYGIPGWQLLAEGHSPHILTDRVILTPPHPGSKRGGMWANKPLSQPEWSAEFHFRSNGEERASGNLQLWFVKDGMSKIGTSSIYTVGPFDGFVLTFDTHGGRGGMVRGFLNDGTKDYKKHASVDSLAFGHCEYSYRNLGYPSMVRLEHTAEHFAVTINDQPCFKSSKVTIPPGNYFGISAASADNPDSFEVFKFVASTLDGTISGGNSGYRPYQAQQRPNNFGSNNNNNNNNNPAGNADTAALSGQVDSLRDRVAGVDRSMSNEFQQLRSKTEELLKRIPDREALKQMDSRLQRMEQTLDKLQKEVGRKDFDKQFKNLQDTLQKSHLGVLEQVQYTSHAITSSAPRMGLFIFLVISVQVALAGGYVYYKKRRAGMPKKFI